MRKHFAAWLTLVVTSLACGGGGGSGGDDGETGTDSTGTAGPPTGTDGDTDGVPTLPDGVGIMGMRRLTRVEYDNTILDILGDDTRPGIALLPEDKKTPFDNDFAGQSASRVLIEAAETLAGDIAERLVADEPRRANVVGCTPAQAEDAACMESFVRHFGRLALRRPLVDDEVTDYVELGLQFAGDGDDFYAGVEVVVRALLQDAEFLYRIELGTPIPDDPGAFELSGFEIATRMSYLIWGSTPDDELLDDAEAGMLDDAGSRRQVAERMLATPAARVQLDRFHSLWLGYSELPHTPDLTNAMRNETAALIERVVFDEQRAWLELFTFTETFADDDLAQHYGLGAPGSSEPVWVDYGATGRQGILSHGAFLSVAANPDDTSPTKRGKLIRNRLLCQEVPPPPPDVEADAPPDSSIAECKYDRYEVHRQPGSCKGCHDQMDPIGFGLENYDIAGRYREHDDGAPQCIIEGEGDLVGVGTFNGPAELSDLLIANGDLDACVVDQLYQYAMGHELADEDRVFTGGLIETFRANDHRFGELVLDLAGHEAFGFRMEE